MYYSASSKASKKTKAEKYDQVEIPEEDKISLSDSQMTVLEAILARKSVFFTGAAGGKSFGVNLSMNFCITMCLFFCLQQLVYHILHQLSQIY